VRRSDFEMQRNAEIGLFKELSIKGARPPNMFKADLYDLRAPLLGQADVLGRLSSSTYRRYACGFKLPATLA
jgi:hypothetical protein